MGSDAVVAARERARAASAAAMQKAVASNDPAAIRAQQRLAIIASHPVVGVNSDSQANSRERQNAALWAFDNPQIVDWFNQTPRGKSLADAFISRANPQILAEIQQRAGGDPANIESALAQYNAAHPMGSGSLAGINQAAYAIT